MPHTCSETSNTPRWHAALLKSLRFQSILSRSDCNCRRHLRERFHVTQDCSAPWRRSPQRKVHSPSSRVSSQDSRDRSSSTDSVLVFTSQSETSSLAQWHQAKIHPFYRKSPPVLPRALSELQSPTLLMLSRSRCRLKPDSQKRRDHTATQLTATGRSSKRTAPPASGSVGGQTSQETQLSTPPSWHLMTRSSKL